MAGRVTADYGANSSEHSSALTARARRFVRIHPNDLRDGPSETDVPAATEQPHDQDNDKDNSEYPTDAVTTTPAVVAAAVISEASAEEEY